MTVKDITTTKGKVLKILGFKARLRPYNLFGKVYTQSEIKPPDYKGWFAMPVAAVEGSPSFDEDFILTNYGPNPLMDEGLIYKWLDKHKLTVVITRGWATEQPVEVRNFEPLHKGENLYKNWKKPIAAYGRTIADALSRFVCLAHDEKAYKRVR